MQKEKITLLADTAIVFIGEAVLLRLKDAARSQVIDKSVGRTPNRCVAFQWKRESFEISVTHKLEESSSQRDNISAREPHKIIRLKKAIRDKELQHLRIAVFEIEPRTGSS